MFGDRSGPPDRRTVSLRWIVGTVLTGITGVVLMGGALLAAVEGKNQLAEPPELMQASRGIGNGQNSFGRKTDRLTFKFDAPVPSRQVLNISTVTKQGDKNLVRMKPFIRISAPLFGEAGEKSRQIPSYDPLAIFADTTNQQEVAKPTDQIFSAEIDGEMTVKTVPLPIATRPIEPDYRIATALIEKDVRLFVSNPDGVNMVDDESDAAWIDEVRVDYSGNSTSPLAEYAITVIPENVTVLTKAAPEDASIHGHHEQIITVTDKMSLEKVLTQSLPNKDKMPEIMSSFASLMNTEEVVPGQKLRLAFAADPEVNGDQAPLRVSVYSEYGHLSSIATTDSGAFVPSEPPSDHTIVQESEDDRSLPKGGLPKTFTGLYQSVLANGGSKSAADELVRIFAFDLEFQNRVTQNDYLDILYTAEDEASEEQEIIFAAIKSGNVEKSYYRFATSDDGLVDFYDENGKSAKQFLLRKPMTGGRMRSGFGYRIHPIHKYRKLHAGVDWAAPRGTPILAAGDGVVIKAGWSSGYGRFTRIKHSNGYVTAYAHQSKIAKWIKPGVRVRQRQVIGYVGSTGLSTGNHLHYEVVVNGTKVDPLRIRLPRGRILTGNMLKAFNAEKERINDLLDRYKTNNVTGNRKLASIAN